MKKLTSFIAALLCVASAASAAVTTNTYSGKFAPFAPNVAAVEVTGNSDICVTADFPLRNGDSYIMHVIAANGPQQGSDCYVAVDAASLTQGHIEFCFSDCFPGNAPAGIYHVHWTHYNGGKISCTMTVAAEFVP